jgi:hypothetical protein
MEDEQSWMFIILGNVVHQAIVDYSKGVGGQYYHEAKEFLFTNRFDKWLQLWQLEDKVNVSVIRKFAKNYNSLVRKNGRRIDERKDGDNEP